MKARKARGLVSASYVAMAGYVKDRIDQKILADVKTKLQGGFKPRWLA